MALPSAMRVGPYEVLAPLGAGGMGEVYRARDPRLGREVAIKVLAAVVATDPERLRRFELEARATGTLNHPNILAVFDVGSHDGAPYVVSELLEGETLRERLGAGGLPLRKALEFAGQVAMGLAAAHEKGIVHRDLKPENLFLTRDGRAKILDFGLAKLVAPLDRQASEADKPTQTHDATGSGVVLGTVGYMSPEQVRGLAADARSDIFAFGSVLYEILARRRAFQGETAAETMTAILREEPPALESIDPTLPPALDRIVKRCLEKRSEERFQSVRDVAFAIEALSSVSTKAPALQESPPRRVARVVRLALAGLAIAALSVLAAKPLWQPPPPKYTQLTFRRGNVSSARFAPDGQTIVYGAAWEGRPSELFSTRPDGLESRPLGITNADILSISSTGSMAVSLDHVRYSMMPVGGTLARVPLSGGAPRVMLEDVSGASWAPDGTRVAVTRLVEGKWRLEFPIGTVLYETDAFLNYPSISPRGDLVAFVEFPTHDPGIGTVASVDLSGKKRALVPDLTGPRDAHWVPDGKELWFTAMEGGGSLRALSPSGRERVVQRFPGIVRLADVFRDGRVLLIRCGFRVSVFARMPGGEQESDFSWLDSSNLADLSADGRTLVFSETWIGGGPRYGVYLRRTDGAPAVRLGDGRAWALSPDGKWVLSTTLGPPPQIVLLPTGAGEPRSLGGGVENFRGGSWFPDSRRLVFAGNVAGKGARLFLADIDGGSPQPIGPADLGLEFPVVSPDGRSVAATSPEGVVVVHLRGGGAEAVSGVEPGELPIQWAVDSRSLYVYRPDQIPAKVYQVDLGSGRRRLFKEISVADPTGLEGRIAVVMTPNGQSYAYSFTRVVSELFLVEGLR